MSDIKLKTDDRHFGDRLKKFRVRASVEFSFSMEVKAHHEREAKLVAEYFCEAMGGGKWQELAENVHKTFESEPLGKEKDNVRKPKR